MSEYDDDGAYGHVSLGRSFALEIGSVIPRTDQKLSKDLDSIRLAQQLISQYIGAIDRHGNFNVNTASDFIAQYTTRQEYRHAEALPDCDQDWLKSMHLSSSTLVTIDIVR